MKFGFLYFPTIPRVHRDEFKPRIVSHIFVGYPFDTKGYTVLNLATKKINISRDVVLIESVFPFIISHDASIIPIVFNSIPFITNVHTQIVCPPDYNSRGCSSTTI